MLPRVHTFVNAVEVIIQDLEQVGVVIRAPKDHLVEFMYPDEKISNDATVGDLLGRIYENLSDPDITVSILAGDLSMKVLTTTKIGYIRETYRQR